ncbi:Inhibitor of carbonic anhydrase, partial [Lemmus lemmus]
STADPQTHYYAVALVKKGTGFQLNQLRGKKSCHAGMGWSAGWYTPLSKLLPPGSLETGEAVGARCPHSAATFFSSSCVPCADGKTFPSLCQLCAGKGTDKCACSSREPYFGYSGALKCLQDGAGDVSFVRHLTVFEADRDQYELLCPDNTRRPVEEYEQCHLARIPSHVVVARSVDGKEDLIQELLRVAQKSSTFQLFGSPHGKDLLFTDAARGFLRVPSKMDINLYLGYEYFSDIKNLKRGMSGPGLEDSRRVQWCAVGQQERAKCDHWSAVSGGALACVMEETPEDCIAAITKGEADAMSLDGGFAYIAGHCGLVPVLGENYCEWVGLCFSLGQGHRKGYYVVAVVKKSDIGITWNSLQGKKSCHTAVGTSAGWTVPLGLIYNQTGSCKFDEFFSRSCAPGSKPGSSLCALCIGGDNPAHIGPNKCAPNNKEGYFGYTGAFRCLVEKGDVAFVKHQTLWQNTEGKNPEAWAKDLKLTDFELLCPDGTRKPVTEYASCYLAQAPNHVVVSRKEKAARVSAVLLNQQTAFGSNADCSKTFCLFSSNTKDLLFRDDTKCLFKVPDGTTWEKYLGEGYVQAVGNMKKCSTSRLLEACTFHKN